MIQTFGNRVLERFFLTGNAKGIHPNLVKRVRRQLGALDDANRVEDLDLPGVGLHPLSGQRKGEWAITVTRNWRMTFRFEDGNAYDVNLEDYH